MNFNLRKKLIFSTVLVCVSIITLGFILEVSARLINWEKKSNYFKSNRAVYPQSLRKHALRMTELQAPKIYKKLEYLPKVKSKKTSNFNVFHKNNYKIYKKSFEGTHVSIAEGTHKEIFNVKYTFDQYGRRETVGSSVNPSQHILLVGCSFTFGEGLEDKDTLSSQLQKIDSSTSYYNFGKMGGSVVDVIISQDELNSWDGIVPKTGFVLFNFSSRDHMPRFLGTIKTVGSWNAWGAYLEKDQNKFKFAGIYLDNKFLRTSLSRALAKSKFLEFLGFDWPPINAEAYESYVQAIQQVQKTYQSIYGLQNRLIVYFRPGEIQSAEIIPFLEKYQILYLDYSGLKLVHYAETELEIPHDGHPSAEYNRLLAQQINNDLKSNCLLKSQLNCER